MSTHPSDDVTLQDVLEAVNNGFTRIQQQNDERFDSIEATQRQHTVTLAEHTATLAEHTTTLAEHTAALTEHTEILETHGDQLTSIQNIQQSEIKERDRQEETLAAHTQRIAVLESTKTA